MSDQASKKQRQLAIRIASSADALEREALRLWIEQLLEVRNSALTKAEKAKQAIAVTAASEVVLPTVKLIARECKRLAWDDRGSQGRLVIAGAAIGVALSGGGGAGIAALGTAVGVPLWVVFGAGAAFLGVLYEEITGKKIEPKTSYRIIDAECKEEG